MDKRLQKRHKRQVARAREKVKLSEPDVRTQEQIEAAREASRAVDARRGGTNANYSAPSVRNQAGPASHSSAKVDA
ncbi:MAG: hypothetical protein ABI823_19440 [Bryobacteraceae bacterium]